MLLSIALLERQAKLAAQSVYCGCPASPASVGRERSRDRFTSYSVAIKRMRSNRRSSRTTLYKNCYYDHNRTHLKCERSIFLVVSLSTSNIVLQFLVLKNTIAFFTRNLKGLVVKQN